MQIGQLISAIARAFNVHPATIYLCINEIRTLWPLTVPFMRRGHRLFSSSPKRYKNKLSVRMARFWGAGQCFKTTCLSPTDRHKEVL